MRKWLFLLACVMAAHSVAAQGIPDYMLDMEYKSCMNGPGGTSAQKANYCLCVRKKIASWDLNTLERIGEQAANTKQPPPEMQELAKECIAATLQQ
jgi:hypothetical protein